jgi:hypothetical protein
MGNSSSKDQWAGRERLALIERVAWWRGAVNRGDLREVFGISAAQASADLQGYQELNPTALAYNLRTKRYEALPEMACVMHLPRLEEAVAMFLGAGLPSHQGVQSSAKKVDQFVPPSRRAEAKIERRVFLAIDRRRKLRIKYWSVKSGGEKWREIAPHALGFDGFRWHARAWCFENGDYRDFVLSRMEDADWPNEEFEPTVEDEAWSTEVRLVLRANRDLQESQRKTIERDYGMRDGKLEITVRAAMKDYYLAQLRLPVAGEDGGILPRHLEWAGDGD